MNLTAEALRCAPPSGGCFAVIMDDAPQLVRSAAAQRVRAARSAAVHTRAPAFRRFSHTPYLFFVFCFF
jgi:hypothetical protein